MAYFVTSLPKSCFFCDCCHERDYDRYMFDGKIFCGIENMQVDDYYDHNLCGNIGRPNWCPLKEIPDDCLDKMIDN